MAPGQLLLVRRQIDEGEGQAAKVLAVTAARGLRRGDELVVLGGAKGGDSSWPVVRLTVQFHEPPVTTLVLENLRPRHFEISRGALVNDGIAVVLSVPSEVEGLRGRAPEAPSGYGRNAGTAPGPIINKGQNASAPEDGPIATLRRGATEDAIHFPDDAKMDLEKFGGDLLASFEAAAPRLRAPAVATSPLLRYWEEKFGGQHVRWFHSTSDVAGELRIWVEELVRKRKQFLKEPRSLALPPILLQEMVLASWLQAAGAPELANLVLGDLMELVIFAGCEPARERDRLGSHLGLALVLYGPGFVRGEKPGRPTEPVSPAAQRLVRELGGDDLLSNGEVVLGALYRKWRKQAESIGTWWPRLWEPFTAADMALDRKGAAAAAQSEFGALVSRQVRAGPGAAAGRIDTMTPCRPHSGRIWSCATVLLALSLAAASAAPQQTVDGDLAAKLKLEELKDFLEEPEQRLRESGIDVDEDVKPRAQLCYQNARTRPEAQQAMRRLLERRWLNGEPSPGLTFLLFESLAQVCPPFPDDRAGLLELLARSEAPRSWRDPAPRRWLRQERAGAPAAPWAARLLAPGLSSSLPVRVDRYAFLLDLLADVPADLEAVRTHFRAAAWDKATLPEIAAYVLELEALEQPGSDGAGGRLLAPNKGLMVRRALGTRLLRATAVTDWPAVRKVLRSLAEATEGGPGLFLDRAATTLRTNPGSRDVAGMAGALLALVEAAVACEEPVATARTAPSRRLSRMVRLALQGRGDPPASWRRPNWLRPRHFLHRAERLRTGRLVRRS